MSTNQAQGEGFNWRHTLESRRLCWEEKERIVEKLYALLNEEQRQWLLELAQDHEYNSFGLLREVALKQPNR